MRKNYTQLAQYKGKLADKAALLEFLKLSDQTDVKLGQLYCYAYMSYNEGQPRQRKSRRDTAGFTGCLPSTVPLTSFVSPVGFPLCPTVERCVKYAADPDFSDYDVMLKNILSGKKHILSAEEEMLMANVGSFSSQFQEVFSRLDSGDIKFRKITVDGKKVQLGHGVYSMLLQHKDQAVRKKAFETYYKSYIEVINTLAGLYEGSVKADVFRARARKFKSAMEAALFYEQVDKKVYDNLIKMSARQLRAYASLHCAAQKAFGCGNAQYV